MSEASLNAEMTELWERRLADRVGERVEKTLKLRYGAVVAAALFVMGLTGYSIVNNLVKELVGSTVGPITKEAERTIAQMSVQLEVAREAKKKLDGLVDSINLEAETAQRRIEEFQKRIGKLQEEFEGTLGTLQEQLGTVAVRRRELEADIARNNKDVVEAIATLRTDLTAVATQLSTLAQTTSVGREDSTPFAAVAAAAAAVAEKDKADDARAMPPTVFLQVARTMLPDRLRALADRLRGEGFVLPNPSREATDAREVRYFYAEDLAAAGEVARAAEAVLTELGHPGVTVAVKDFTAYPKVKPRQGTVELWLALPEPKAEPKS